MAYNIDIKLFIINPEIYIETVNNLYELRDQIASFNNPLDIKTEEDLKILDFISNIEPLNINELNNNKNLNNIKKAFDGLFPEQKKQKMYRQKIARIFKCDDKVNNNELLRIAVHFIGSDYLPFFVEGCTILLNNFQTLKQIITDDINSENLYIILSILSSLTFQENDILIGWSRYENE